MVDQSSDRADFLSGHDVSRETMARLDRIIETLDGWRLKVNLVGPKEWPMIWQRHVWDSLQIVDEIPETSKIVDLGSGAGFPGLMIAAARPLAHVTLIESVGKKCAFLRAAIDAADLSATVHQGRVEVCPVFPVDFVTARAFAPLPKLLEYGAPWLENGAIGVFHKGERWHEELTQAQQSWNFAYEATPSRSGGGGVILKIMEFKRGIKTT